MPSEREMRKKIVAKALDGQRYPLPLCEHMFICDGERGSGSKGANDLCLQGVSRVLRYSKTTYLCL